MSYTDLYEAPDDYVKVGELTLPVYTTKSIIAEQIINDKNNQYMFSEVAKEYWKNKGD